MFRLRFSARNAPRDPRVFKTMLSTIPQLTTHYLMRSVLPATLGKDEAIYVEYGFTLFVAAEN